MISLRRIGELCLGLQQARKFPARWQELQFAGFPVDSKGHLRGMIGDVAVWKEVVIEPPVAGLTAPPMRYTK